MQAKLFPGDSNIYLDIESQDLALHGSPGLSEASLLSAPYISSTTALATGDSAGSARPNGGSLIALPEIPVKDDQLQRIPWGSASVNNSYDKVHTLWNGTTTSLCACPLIPKDSGTFPSLDFSALMSCGDGEQDHTLKRDSNAGRWSYEYLLPISEYPVKDDHLQRMPLGLTSPNCLTSLVHTPWNGNTVSSDPHLQLPKDDGTALGLHVSGFALHGDGKQCHTVDRELKAEQGPSEHCVPFEHLPACRSKPRRKRRRFTNGEKAVIRYKRKMGVCVDCRQAKRKASLVMTSVFFC